MRGGADRQAERRRDQPVGELLGVVLHAGVADRRRFDQPRDLPGGGEIADADGAHRQLAVADDGGGEHRFTFRPHDRQALAGDGLLIDHGVAVDDLAVDGNHLAGIDDDLVADHELGGRYRDNDVVANDPGRFGLEFEQLAHRLALTGRGQIADPVAELDQPGDDRAGHGIALHQRGGDRERIEEIDVEASLTPNDPPGAQRDRIGVPQHQRHVDGGDDRIGAERHQQRQRRQSERCPPPQRRMRRRLR